MVIVLLKCRKSNDSDSVFSLMNLTCVYTYREGLVTVETRSVHALYKKAHNVFFLNV